MFDHLHAFFLLNDNFKPASMLWQQISIHPNCGSNHNQNLWYHIINLRWQYWLQIELVFCV